MSRSDAERVGDVIAAADTCSRYLRLRVATTDLELMNVFDDAIRYNLQIVGEAAGRLPARIIDAHPELPWQEIRGFRNVLVHQYFSVDPEVVRDVIENHLPRLVDALRPYLAS